ncbi:hypothetical protein CCACVL1_05917 [Corchorus capsularis]|uniref:Uncharacterized protein n=1 Tax=Corchorus capsularis TaxID=210143 RepID=A0A1R3JII3_COCAP|nr:hypothetical protein CCACVL1_05917 [Corchorus capsularis]
MASREVAKFFYEDVDDFKFLGQAQAAVGGDMAVHED